MRVYTNYSQFAKYEKIINVQENDEKKCHNKIIWKFIKTDKNVTIVKNQNVCSIFKAEGDKIRRGYMSGRQQPKIKSKLDHQNQTRLVATKKRAVN